MAKSVCTHSIRVEHVGTSAKITPPSSQKARCDGGIGAGIPISPLQNHTLVQNHSFVVTIIEHTYQSQPCLTIHYTYDETLGGLRCCEVLESIQTYSIRV
eukprot:scaffold40976_cov60-Cyclotella_meneghiniana.AAC.1